MLEIFLYLFGEKGKEAGEGEREGKSGNSDVPIWEVVRQGVYATACW